MEISEYENIEIFNNTQGFDIFNNTQGFDINKCENQILRQPLRVRRKRLQLINPSIL